jgi:hypothetical protein
LLWSAEAKALGFVSANQAGVDGFAGFAKDINPNSLVGVALHEFTHALGRAPSGLPLSFGDIPDIFDLFRFDSANDTRLVDGDFGNAPPSYFSVDNGGTVLANYGEMSDPGDFLNDSLTVNDPFDEFYVPGATFQSLTLTDLMVGNGIVDVLSGGTANVSFQATGSGGLEIADSLANSSAFTGKISGFGGANHTNHAQFIDLVSVTSAPGQIHLSYSSAASHTSGTLFVSSGGAVVAQINMIGNYTSANFSTRADSDGSVEIVDPAVPNGGIAFGAQTTLAYTTNGANGGGTLTVGDGRHAASIALLGNYIAGSFAIGADGHGGTVVTQQSQTPQAPLLTHPHG